MLLRRSWAVSVRRLAPAAFLFFAGCVTIDPGGDGDPDPNDDTAPGTIRINVINATDTTLDPEIHVSATPVSVSDLFAAGNKYTGFGVGTLGLLGPFGSDSFTLTCDQVRVLGTRGGRFGDNLNAPDGSGRQIVLTQELNIFCDGEVTLTYSRSQGGFTTTFDVQP